MKRLLKSQHHEVTNPKPVKREGRGWQLSVQIRRLDFSEPPRTLHFTQAELLNMWYQAQAELRDYKARTDKWSAKRVLKPQETDKLKRYIHAEQFLGQAYAVLQKASAKPAQAIKAGLG